MPANGSHLYVWHRFVSSDAKALRDIAEVPLTRGQVNAVRAAFKAGITPSRTARQFGISQSNVREVSSFFGWERLYFR
jgi:hypothetical protein